ncbi:MAG: alpha-amylase family glycosyl hydrolase [bacterium]|nr:alpha-amylase family glycosyl hydrolase [bacterium]
MTVIAPSPGRARRAGMWLALATLVGRAADFEPQLGGYEIINALQTVRFIYAPATYGTTAPLDVYVAGSFNGWAAAHTNRTWRLKPQASGVLTLEVPRAWLVAHSDRQPPEFKFITADGTWQEPQRVPARYQHTNNLWLNSNAFRPAAERMGYDLARDCGTVTFVLNPVMLGVTLAAYDPVYVVGTFNGWAGAIGNPAWVLAPNADGTLLTLTTNTAAVLQPGISGYPEFKFATRSNVWLALAAVDDAYLRNDNLWVNLDVHGDITPPRPLRATLTSPTSVTVQLTEPVAARGAAVPNFQSAALDIQSAHGTPRRDVIQLTIASFDLPAHDYQISAPLVVQNLCDTSGVGMTQPVSIPVEVDGALVQRFFDTLPASTQALGFTLAGSTAQFRVFGPRLRAADLLLYDRADDPLPALTVPLQRDAEFIWCATLASNLAPHGRFYQFAVTRGGVRTIIGDPYAKAVVHSAGKSIVIWPGVDEPPFAGWTDAAFTTPPMDELVIYETHLANLTGRNRAVTNLAHRYLAMTVDAPGSPLRYLQRLGVNAIEFLPLHEFENGSSLDVPAHYSWGYMTALFFTPESSFSTDPAARRQVSEFKAMVDALHAHGLAVIVDVVYNHTVNGDNFLATIDPDYYFTGRNDSGCGNTVYASRPMTRKLILDSLRHLVATYHVDGFRFDLAHLVDAVGLLTPPNKQSVQAVKPTRGNLLWIVENWSWDRADLKGRGAAQWNDWFREDVKQYLARGERRDSMPQRIMASRDRNAYATPLESVNYTDSHDEETLAHRIASAGWQGAALEARARMGLVLLLTAQGVPMLWEGQEWLRCNPAQVQSYAGNVVNWEVVQTNAPTVDFTRRLIALRKQYRALRSPRHESAAYYSWLRPGNASALGYVINANRQDADEPRFLVLLNPGATAADFTLPGGDWQELADARGFHRTPVPLDARTLRLEGGELRLCLEPARTR